MIWIGLSLLAALLWLALLAAPWRPTATAECLDSDDRTDSDLGDVTVLIPARDEADTIGRALQSVRTQGTNVMAIVVDDQSRDGTAAVAQAAMSGAHVITGTPTPRGWAGKVWALEQGRSTVATPYTLLMDADIELAPGIVATLRHRMQRDDIAFLSLMPALEMTGFWEKLLLPAFVYFFKLMYPFRLASDPMVPQIAAAAGGCIMLETAVLDRIGGFVALRGALIDDCTLAARVKQLKCKTWIGLTHSVTSIRRYRDFSDIANMVARSAYTQLGYSMIMLLLTTGIMILTFCVPIAALVLGPETAQAVAVVALAAMFASYVPTILFYRLSGMWVPTLPLAGVIYLALTWLSAGRYWRGSRAQWKGRHYERQHA
ncbi:MAG TPA: glycosyltransferase [Burkholderiales bacterium]|jgi:hopene-associated glycosyltransferase HpnB|nr:glycosyltransferase [Burkholderiales bacterium]